MTLPELPEQLDWPQQTREWWLRWRSDPSVGEFTPADWDYLLETALLHAQFWLGDSSVSTELRLRLSRFRHVPSSSIAEATEGALAAATHLTEVDEGAVQMLRALAVAADAIDENGLNPAGKLDNVSIPTYLRYAESLGLTPNGRKSLEIKEEARGKLASVRDLRDRQAPSKKRAGTN